MKKFRTALPILLMIWPYLFLLCALLPENSGEQVAGVFLWLYTVLTVVVYVLNIWNAITYKGENAEYKLARYDMLLKLLHIPYYLGLFAISLLFVMAMVVPALTFAVPIGLLTLSIIEFFLMMTSSVYGISAAAKAARKKIISKGSAACYIVFHCMFVTDVISAVLLFWKMKVFIRKEHHIE